MLSQFFSIYLTITIIFCFIRIRAGIGMYLFYSILVPVVQFFSFGQNFFTLLILIALLFKYKPNTLTFKPIKPFLFLYLAQLAILPFHDDISYVTQLNYFRINFMSTILLPFAMINVMEKDPKAIGLFNKIIIVALFIVTAYSLFLISMPGINPYIMLINPFKENSSELYFADYYAGGDGRLFGRISSVFIHPMTNGLFLSFSLLFMLSKIDFKSILRSKWKIIILLLIVFAILFIGVRTAIATVFIGTFVFLFFERKFKLVIYVSVFVFLLMLVIQLIPGMESYTKSMVDPESSSVKGSSIEMRMNQLDGAFDEIKDNYLFGKGYEWTRYYRSEYGSHPKMLSFESLLIVILCNSGFVGIFIWVGMILLYIKEISKHHHSRRFIAIMFALLATYLSYSLITGEYGYMKFFLIFYSILWMSDRDYSLIR